MTKTFTIESADFTVVVEADLYATTRNYMDLDNASIPVFHGDYKGVAFKAVSYNGCPQVYIANKTACKSWDDEDMVQGIVGNEVTYISNNLLGWDYAHYGMFINGPDGQDGHRFTLKEVLEEVVRSIDELFEYDLIIK